jgi:hypothetical protein
VNKKFCGILSVVLGFIAYAYMITSTIMGTGEGLSFTTFILWGALAWISGFSTLKQGVNPAVPMMYGVGATSTALVLLCKGRFQWTTLDTFIFILVVICIVLWMTRGPKWALILSIAASAIASVPFMVMTWKTPESSPIIPNTLFVFTNFLYFLSGKEWTLKDRLYGAVNAILCSFFVIPWMINFFNK